MTSFCPVAVLLVALALAGFGCSSEGPRATPSTSGGTGGEGGGDSVPFGGDRPVELFVPSSYDPAVPMPLVLMLHGYGASGQVEEWLYQLQPEAEARSFLYAHPDGTVDAEHRKFWNATDACCDFAGSGVDDSAYLIGLIDEIKSRYNVDPKRVYLTGHSNGGFMSHRMACEHADAIAAVAALAGVEWIDASKCAPSEPVAVLQIHGTADETVLYEGGKLDVGGQVGSASYPGAETTLAEWAKRNGCSTSLTPSASLDLDATLAGSETDVSRYDSCAPGGAAELWKMVGVGHVPNMSAQWAPSIVDFFFAHPKP
jgi:polyhydroxybutyrate depolymerase